MLKFSVFDLDIYASNTISTSLTGLKVNVTQSHQGLCKNSVRKHKLFLAFLLTKFSYDQIQKLSH